MYGGILLSFLALMVLIAPVVWLLWWGADSIAGAVRPIRVPATPRPVLPAALRRQSFPRPSDTMLPGHRDAIAVYDLSGGPEVATCHGPDAFGRCPFPHADGTVPCAAHLLVLPVPVRGSRDWHVPAGYRNCLVGSYSAYRQPAQ